MTTKFKRRLSGCTALMLAVVMLISLCPLSAFAAEVITQGLWTITNDEAAGIGEAAYGDIGFIYHSPTTTMTYGSSGGKDYVRSNNTNGSASNGVVVTNQKSYCDFTPKADGTLTVFVGNAPSKTGYISRTKNGVNEAISSFVPGGDDNYDVEGVVKVTKASTWAAIEIEVEKDYTYYITLSGSKMFCYGAEYVPYTQVSGTIADSFNLGSYEIKFTNKETGLSKAAQVNGSSYSILLKPGFTYSASLTGANGTGYAVSSSTRLVEVKAQASQTANLSIEKSISYTVSGSISGMAAGYNSGDMKLVFVPDDTTSYEEVSAELDKTALTYKAQLTANENYTLKLIGAYDYKLAENVVVTNDSSAAVTRNIAFSPVPAYEVSGKFIGLTQVRGQYETLAVTPAAITFENVEDKYVYSGNAANNTYTANLRDGSYLASITLDGYSTTTHVVVKGGKVERDILLKAAPKAVEYKDTLYVGSDKEYKSVQAAVDAATNMTRANGERVTIKLDPGVYREQVVVNTPNVTLESNGGTRDNTKITWYYGIGYKYYSSVNSYYDPYADYDKFEKGDVAKYWGSAVITNSTAEGFRAKDITFENSFNKYMTEEEIKDGVEVNGLETINVVRKENTNVDTKAATERAAAYVNYADKTEFLNCSFIGSQDTLYTCNVAYDAYYKNCYIEGQTDFIYGNGDVIFDGCEINFCGYDGTKAAGYLTANSCSAKYMATDGYIFRGCFVSYNGERDVTPGYMGRMWGDSAKVAFINTQLQQQDMIVKEGWGAMSGVEPTAKAVTLKEYNTTYNGEKIDTAGRVNGVDNSLDLSKYTVESVFTANGWTPAYYTGDTAEIPQFTTNPAMTSNGDLNTPNPGETITLGYALGNEWADEDASIISWYAVAEGYNAASLDTILESAELLKVSSASSSNTMQIPIECAGKYIMAVVTPVTISGVKGEPKYIIDKERPVSNVWNDPSNPGSIAPGSGINVYLAGDSTVKDYSAAGIYNGGKILTAGSWGEFLQAFFNKDYVTVNNYAQGGRSVRSFLNEGKLDTVIDNIKAGDYLLMQFGHNDCANGASYYQERFAPLYTKDNQPSSKSEGFPTIKPTAAMKTATPSALVSQYGNTYYSWDCGATYKGYLQEYIDRALAKGAIPVIVSPVAREYYTSDGKIRTHHDASMTDYEPTLDYLTENNAYVTACRELYEENKDKGVLYLDAYELTANMYEDAYKAGGKAYGDAVMDKGDATHSNKTGGVIQAGLIAKWIKDNNISLSQYVAQPAGVYGEEVSGEYIFTIDKNGKFTAKDKELKEQPYWSNYGQTLFDSIGGKQAEPEKAVTLNFATDEALTLYVTNVASTYVDGVYSGVYTNADNADYKVSIYQSGISYYNNDIKYGTKASKNKPIFSFEANEAAEYTIKVAASTGSGTIGLYTDAECKNPVATAASTDILVYKKTDSAPQVLYFATPDAGNMYLKEISLSHVVPKAVTLDFETDEAMELYETNADSTYVNGVYTGTYTNEEGQSYDVSVYRSGISYYNKNAHYGTKLMPSMPVFSFVADEKAMYTITATHSTSSTTAGLFRDAACTEPVVTGTVGGTLVYKKTTAAPEVLYFGTAVNGNTYMPKASITKTELPMDVKVLFKGDISGAEADDTNVIITLKGATETLTVSAEDYLSNGLELIVGETYAVSAKGDKGYYLGTDIVTDDSGVANLILFRLSFDFPLDFIENFDDYNDYLTMTGAEAKNVEDAYSGITIHRSGVLLYPQYKQYGAKTNSKDIISFAAEKTGVCSVTVDVSVSNSDKLILKVNDVYAPVLTNAVSGKVTLSVMANKGDKITLYTPTRSNLWYKSIDVAYTEGAFVYGGSAVNNNEVLVYGTLADTMTDKLAKVGICFAAGLASSIDESYMSDESAVVYSTLLYNGNNIASDGNKLFGTVISDIDTDGELYAYTYGVMADGTKVYSAPVKISLN